MKPVYYLGWTLSRAACRFYFTWRVYDAERVPAQGRVILAANHASFFDPFAIGSGVRREICFLARASAFHFPLGALLRRVNAVPVDRDGGGPGGLLKVLEILRQDRGLVLFPEGTRTRDGRLQPARSGIGLVVIKSGAPVVPVRVFGSYEAWNRHMTWPRPGRRLIIKYGRLLDFAAAREEAAHCSKERLKAIYQEVADQIMAAIAALQPGPDA